MAKLPRYNEKAETKKADSWQKKVDKLQTKIDKQQAKIDKEEEREMEAPDAGGYQTISAFIVFEEDEHYEDALRWENISKFQVRKSLRSDQRPTSRVPPYLPVAVSTVGCQLLCAHSPAATACPSGRWRFRAQGGWGSATGGRSAPHPWRRQRNRHQHPHQARGGAQHNPVRSSVMRASKL